MNADEAQTIACIAAWVDGGCPYCVRSVMRQLADHFPDHDWRTLIAAERNVTIEWFERE